jgi:hypothetical protein
LAGTCIFCENKADSKEHAIPKWIAKRFGLKGEFLGEIASIHAPAKKQHTSIGSHRAMILCNRCQSHFGRLENAVANTLTAMGRGESLILDAEKQELLGRWGAKTAMTLIAAERDDDGTRRIEEIPRAHRLPIRWGTVPEHIYVAYGSYDDQGVRLTLGTPMLEEIPGDYSARTYNAVFAFGQVLLKVFSVFEPTERDRFGLPLLRGQPVLTQMWPPRFPEVVWPLANRIGGEDAFMFVPLIF